MVRCSPFKPLTLTEAGLYWSLFISFLGFLFVFLLARGRSGSARLSFKLSCLKLKAFRSVIILLAGLITDRERGEELGGREVRGHNGLKI